MSEFAVQTPAAVDRRLLDAVVAVADGLELDPTLRRIVRAASDLTGAPYAALGVLGDDGLHRAFVHTGMDPELVAPDRQASPRPWCPRPHHPGGARRPGRGHRRAPRVGRVPRRAPADEELPRRAGRDRRTGRRQPLPRRQGRRVHRRGRGRRRRARRSRRGRRRERAALRGRSAPGGVARGRPGGLDRHAVRRRGGRGAPAHRPPGPGGRGRELGGARAARLGRALGARDRGRRARRRARRAPSCRRRAALCPSCGPAGGCGSRTCRRTPPCSCR